MFGKNPLEKKDHGDGYELRVVKGSPFRTIQGEGPYSGWPAIFIRLHGCNLACTFCDTQFSDPKDPVEPITELVRRTRELFGPEKRRLVVITGGEPMRQNIYPLCRELGFLSHTYVQIETAGTIWIPRINEVADIVVSPKTPTIVPEIRTYAKAFKYVIDAEQELDGFVPITATQRGTLPRKLAEAPPLTPVYLSPMDVGDPVKNKGNEELCGRLAVKYGCRVGLQIHKHMGLA